MSSRARVLTIVLSAALSSPLAVAGCGKDDAAKQASDGTIVTPYLAIADTLAQDEIKNLPELGAAVIKAAESKPAEPGVDKIIQGAGRIAAQDIATARQAFKTMSEGMIEYLHAHDDKRSGKMIVHCTMTFAGKGAAWVQPEGKVMNPYEGAMMLHCGDKIAWDAKVPE